MDKFVDYCIDSDRMLPLLIALLDKLNISTGKGDWPADPPDTGLGSVPVLSDGTIDLTGGVSESITLQLIFKNTGERFHVQLPLDLDCDVAAQRIIVNILFRDIPISRRAAYLAPGAHYHLLEADEHVFLKGSIRKAGLKADTEILVATVAPMDGYPWKHDAATADSMLDSHFASWTDDIAYRLQGYACSYVSMRLSVVNGTPLYGLQYLNPRSIVQPWDVSTFQTIAESSEPVPAVILELLRDTLSGRESSPSYARVSAAEAIARLNRKAEELIPLLVENASDKNPDVSRACMIAVGIFAPTSSYAYQEASRLAEHASYEITRLFAALVCLIVKDGERPRRIIEEIVSSKRAKVRVSVAESLGLGVTKLVSRVLDRGDAAVLKLKQQTDREVEVVVSHLITMLTDSNPRVRYEAASALGWHGEASRPAVPLLAKLLRDTDKATIPASFGSDESKEPEVCEAAENTLEGLGPVAREAVPALVSIVTDKTIVYYLRNRAASALEAIGITRKEDRKRLEAFAQHPDDADGVRESVARLLADRKSGSK
jgi:HEAT repeat protein